jgi:hypothetical protein
VLIHGVSARRPNTTDPPKIPPLHFTSVEISTSA